MDNFIGRNIQAFRAHKGLSQEGLGKIIELSQTTTSAWEDGKSLPRKANASRLFEAFPELSYDDIFSDEHGFARKVINRERGADVVNVALYGSISAGLPIEMIPNEDFVPIPGQLFNAHPKSFFLRVSGESMNRMLPNGCLALIDPKSEFIDGGVYAVCVGKTDATIKIVNRKKNRVELVPDSYDPRFKKQSFRIIDDEESPISILGRVVWFCAPLDYSKKK